MKKRFLMTMLFVFSLFVFTACNKETGNSDKETDAMKIKEEYESLNGTIREKDGKTIRSIEISEDNPFIYKTESDIVKMIENKETFVVYFGFPDCPWCRSMISTLVSVANDLGLDKIYYVNVKNIRDTLSLDEDGNVITDTKGTDGYYDLLDLLGDVLEEYTLEDKDNNEVNTGEKRIFAPNVISVVDGKAIEITDGISEEQTDGYMELTSKMKEESYNKLKCSIQCVVDNKKTCSAKSSC